MHTIHIYFKSIEVMHNKMALNAITSLIEFYVKHHLDKNRAKPFVMVFGKHRNTIYLRFKSHVNNVIYMVT